MKLVDLIREGFNIGETVEKISKPIVDTIDNLHTSEEERQRLKLEFEKLKHEMELEVQKTLNKELEARKDVLLAEMTGNNYQRNWRPTLMYMFQIILFFNFVIFPIAGIWTDKLTMLEYPPQFWTLLIGSMGGYLGLRSYEKKHNKTN